MFKNAAKRLATIPALAGNSRLQPLQELIAAEELILHSCVSASPPTVLTPTSPPPAFSLQGLSTGFGKTSEALKAWNGGEDEGLEVRVTSDYHLTRPRPSTNEGTLEYVVLVLKAAQPLDFVIRIFRHAHREHSGVSKRSPFKGRSARRLTPLQKISHGQSRSRGEANRADQR